LEPSLIHLFVFDVLKVPFSRFMGDYSGLLVDLWVLLTPQ
jgi:hypothetical protein